MLDLGIAHGATPMPFAMSSVSDILITSSWAEGCMQLYGDNNTYGLVNYLGQSLDARNAAWGITLEACNAFCGDDKLQISYDAASFATAFTNSLLPWLALATQLPYESSTWWNEILNIFLALGSPVLIAYSLTLSALNQSWIRHRFNAIRKRTLQFPTLHSKIGPKVDKAEYFLQQAQQVPLRVSDTDGWLSSLVISDENDWWWSQMQDTLKQNRLGITSSLLAQILFVMCSSLIVVLDTNTNSGIESTLAFTWMVPVILGWIYTGTQYGRHTKRYLNSVSRSLHNPTGGPGEKAFSKQSTHGILARSGLNSQPPTTDKLQQSFENPTILGFRIEGDEACEGSFYNYARIFTWTRTSETILNIFFKAVGSRVDQSYIFHPNARSVSGSEDLTERSYVDAYSELHDIDKSVWQRILIAAATSMIVPLGTSGSAALVAYRTPNVGLGCSSASYILYALMAILVWATLAISSYLSHIAMVGFQRASKLHYELSKPYKRSQFHGLVSVLAVVTRLLGKFLAIANAFWIITSVLLQYYGIFDTCWCQTSMLSQKADDCITLLTPMFEDAGSIDSYWVVWMTLAPFVVQMVLERLPRARLGILPLISESKSRLLWVRAGTPVFLFWIFERWDIWLQAVLSRFMVYTRGRQMLGETGKNRIHLSCRCGYTSQQDVIELSPNAVKDYEHRLRQHLNPEQSQSSGPGSSSGSYAFPSSSALRGESGRMNGGNQSYLPQYQPRSQQMLTFSQTYPKPPPDNLFLLLCMPYSKTVSKLVHLPVPEVESDRIFLARFRTAYRGRRGRLKCLLSLRTLQKIQFVHFKLYCSDLVDVRRENDLPPPDNSEYKYYPTHDKIMPPVGEDLLAHFVNYPDHASDFPALMALLPKKSKALILYPGQSTEWGWGVRLVEGWKWSVIYTFAFSTCLLASILFLICWAVLQHDIQGASGVAAYLVGVVALAIGTTQAVLEVL